MEAASVISSSDGGIEDAEMAKPEVKLSQTYRPTGKTYLDRPSAGWTVRKIFTSTDGLSYAQLVNQGDSTLTKTVSLDALTDPRLFLLTAQPRQPGRN
jgi:hypothetical protein